MLAALDVVANKVLVDAEAHVLRDCSTVIPCTVSTLTLAPKELSERRIRVSLSVDLEVSLTTIRLIAAVAVIIPDAKLASPACARKISTTVAMEADTTLLERNAISLAWLLSRAIKVETDTLKPAWIPLRN